MSDLKKNNILYQKLVAQMKNLKLKLKSGLVWFILELAGGRVTSEWRKKNLNISETTVAQI